MILFNDTTTVFGATLANALAWIQYCQIDSTRTLLSGMVTLSMQSIEPDYTPYSTINYSNVPFDYEKGTNAIEQFYEWLMLQPMYEGGTKYPV